MPPAKKKDASVILFDINTQDAEVSKKSLYKIYFKKFCTDSNDVAKIVLTNVAKTSNELNYENLWDVDKAVIKDHDPKRIEHLLEQAYEIGVARSDFLQAISYGISCFENDYYDIDGIVTKQLIFITDLSNTQTIRNKLVNSITDKINELGIYLYIIGLPIKLPPITNNLKSVRDAMKSIVFEGGNQKIIQQIIEKSQTAVVCGYKTGIHIISSFKKFPGGQPWQVPLTFGTVLEIPSWTQRILEQHKAVRFKKRSRFDRAEITWVCKDNEQIEVDFSDVVQGIARHGKFVPMNKDTANMFKFGTLRSFNVLQFTEKSNVPEYYLQGEGSFVVVPNSKFPQCNDALYILIDALAQKGLVAIARRVYAANFRPVTVALIPKPNNNPKCFFMAEVPYADDIIMDYKESNEPIQFERNESTAAVFDFCKQIDISSSDCKIRVPLTPNMYYDLTAEKIINNIADKYLTKNLQLEDLDIDSDIGALPDPLGASLRDVWPERELLQTVGRHEDDSDSEVDE